MKTIEFVLLAVMLLGCARAPDIPIGTGPEADALRARETAYGQALNRHDAAAVAEFCRYCLVVEVQEDADGPYSKSSLGNASLIEDPQSVVDFAYVEVQISGPLGDTRGECSITRTSPRTHRPVFRHGYCTTTWERDGHGVWRVMYESRNVMPPLGAQE